MCRRSSSRSSTRSSTTSRTGSASRRPRPPSRPPRWSPTSRRSARRRRASTRARCRRPRSAARRWDGGALARGAIGGETLFQGRGACIACHGGPLFTDNDMHNTLVPQRNGWNDPGATIKGFPGFFNTPQLRDVRNTAPYMHNGVFKTLRDVIEFYNARSSIAPLHLTPQEMDDLVAYMDAL